MNTHDIELPPLPESAGQLGEYPDEKYDAYDAGMMLDYARTAIEADRQRRGEPVASMLVDHANALHPYRAIPMVNVGLPDGVHMLYTTPQPAEPRTDEPVAWPKVNGVGRDAENERSLVIYFESEPTDAQLRAVHEFLKAPQPDKPVVKDSLTVADEPGKCDGDHAGPRCADPECWNDSPTGQPTPDVRVTPTVEPSSTPLSTQDVTPEEEEEWQRREKKK